MRDVLEIILFDVRQDEVEQWAGTLCTHIGWIKLSCHRRKFSDRAFVVGTGQGNLLHVVAAGHFCSGLANLLHSWQQQPDEDGDDGNHDEEFDERKGDTLPDDACFHGMKPYEEK